jgi:anti-sigma B factor antagonist
MTEVRPELQVAEESVDDTTHVFALRGELDVGTVAELAQPLRDAIARGKTAVVVDLGELTFIDSTGLMVLLNGLRRLIREGGRLALVCTNPTVLRLFEITGTDSTFTICADRASALEAVRGEGTSGESPTGDTDPAD